MNELDSNNSHHGAKKKKDIEICKNGCLRLCFNASRMEVTNLPIFFAVGLRIILNSKEQEDKGILPPLEYESHQEHILKTPQ
jgi:hypothetical protein